MGNLFLHRLWGVVPWSLLALIALGVALVYVVVDTSHDTSGMVWFVQRWFHSLCWLLLALAALAMAQITALPLTWAKPLAISGGVTYAIFLVTTVLTGTFFT